jgi:hypothetical protein
VMLLGPTTRVEERKVLARYDNGASALIEGRIGRGRILLFTSTLDRDWNDLPIHPGYLPLMQQSVRYLARRQLREGSRDLLVGRTIDLAVTPDDARLEVHGPGDRRTVLEGTALADRKRLRFSDTAAPGFYRVTAAAESGAAVPRPEANFAINLDPRGSDLAPIDLARLPTGDDPTAATPSGVHDRRVELWHAIALALLLLLLLEGLATLGDRLPRVTRRNR